MKLIYKLFISGAAILFLLPGCKKSTTENVSKIFKVPVIDLKGKEIVTLNVGGTYTDIGADYIGEDGQTTAIQSSSSNVNVNAPGLYAVTFQQTSASGIYESEAVRLVAVTSVNNPVDYSGTYFREATAVNAYVEKIAPGVYKVTNPGGAAAGTDVVVYFVETALNTFIAPPQPTTAGEMSVIEIAFTGTGSSWKIVNPGYGTGPRVFVKQ